MVQKCNMHDIQRAGKLLQIRGCSIVHPVCKLKLKTASKTLNQAIVFLFVSKTDDECNLID